MPTRPERVKQQADADGDGGGDEIVFQEGGGVMLHQADERLAGAQAVGGDLGGDGVRQGAAVGQAGKQTPGQQRQAGQQDLAEADGLLLPDGAGQALERQRAEQDERIRAGEQGQRGQGSRQRAPAGEGGVGAGGEQQHVQAGFQAADGKGDAVGRHRPQQRRGNPGALGAQALPDCQSSSAVAASARALTSRASSGKGASTPPVSAPRPAISRI